MGHESIRLMDGSLQDFKDAGGAIEEGPTQSISAKDLDVSKPSQYQAKDAQQIRTMDEILAIVKENRDDALVVDVRAKERFLGQVEEPRPGLKKGHIPGSVNLPFGQLLNPDNVVQFKSQEEVVKLLDEAGIDVHTDKDIIMSCGSGVTASTLAVALLWCGRDPSKTFVYDGSWIEWGSVNEDNPVE